MWNEATPRGCPHFSWEDSGRARRLFGQIVVLFLASLVTACGSAVEPGSSPTPPQNVNASGPPLIIGAPLALTGSLAAEGNLTKNGYDLWVEELNKAGGIRIGRQRRTVQIKYYDDESDAQKSAQFAEHLILEEGVGLLLGPYGSAATTRVAEIAERYQVPMVEGNGAAESAFSRGYEYTFGVLSPAQQYAAVMVALAAQQNPKPASLAILFANDAFSVEVAEGAKAFAQSQGIKVPVYERYQVNSTDLSGGVTAAKVAGAEMLLNSGHLVESLAIMKAAKELDYNPKLFAFTVGPATPNFIQTLGEDAEYVVTSSQWADTLQYRGIDIFGTSLRYVELYREKFDSDPDYHAAGGTAAAISLQASIEQAGSLDSKKIRDALASLDMMTFYGRVRFDQRGLNIYKPMVVQQIQDGKLVTVWPPDGSERPLRYPTPPWR